MFDEWLLMTTLLLQELYEELPALYDQRIPNIASHLQTLFAAEATVMAEFSKVSSIVLTCICSMSYNLILLVLNVYAQGRI